MAKISPLLCVSWGMNANKWTIVKQQPNYTFISCS